MGFRLYLHGSFTKEVTVRFLQTLQEKSGKNLIVVLDQAPDFIGNKVKNFVEDTAIDVVYFPARSPDLNPTEECWRQFRKTVGDQYFGSLDELQAALRPALGSIDPTGIYHSSVDEYRFCGEKADTGATDEARYSAPSR